MDKKHRIKGIAFWGLSIFLGWFLGKIVLWNVILSTFPRGLGLYSSRISFFGIVLFLLLSMILSAIRDKKYRIALRNYQDSARVETEALFLEMLTYSFRFSLVGFISVFWYKFGEYWLNLVKIDFNIGGNLFVYLLALGTGLAVITLISSYIVIFEPWRIFIVDFAKQNDNHYRLLLNVGRLFSVLLVNLFHFVYFVPGLNLKILPLISSIIFLLIIFLYRIKKRKASL